MTLGVTVSPVPTAACEYVNVGEPEMLTESGLMIPFSDGEPVAVAVVVRSYVLVNVGGVTVSDFLLMVAVVVGAPMMLNW